MKREEILALPKVLRLSGFLLALAQLDDLGARLRLAHAHESTDYDEKWTEQEELAWETAVDEMEKWNGALSESERKLLDPIVIFQGYLCRGEDPEGRADLSTQIHEQKKKEILKESPSTGDNHDVFHNCVKSKCKHRGQYRIIWGGNEIQVCLSHASEFCKKHGLRLPKNST